MEWLVALFLVNYAYWISVDDYFYLLPLIYSFYKLLNKFPCEETTKTYINHNFTCTMVAFFEDLGAGRYSIFT